jgi:hypothetical protein
MCVCAFQPSTCQLVVTSGGANETYVTFVYGEVGTRRARAGVLVGQGAQSLVLPGSDGDSTQLRRGTNVGAAGRWMFR